MHKNWLTLITLAAFALSASPGFCEVVPAPTGGHPTGSGGVNAPEYLEAPCLVVVSLDGFRWDYPDRFDLPAFTEITRRGMRAERLLPVFPTKTFPNHYSIATGLYPSRHGIVGNEFPVPELDRWYKLSDREIVGDGRVYAGEPIWVTAETQGMVSAAFYFVGTEAAVSGVRPTHWRQFDRSVEGTSRVDQVLDWLSQAPETRPHLIMLYFETVDDYSHWKGVISDRATEAIKQVDMLLSRLINGIDGLAHGRQVGLLVVSDHGQSNYRSPADPWVLDEHVALEGLHVVGRGSYLNIYFETQDRTRLGQLQADIQASWKRGKALQIGELPAEWHVSQGPRQPDLFLLPDAGEMVLKERSQLQTISPGEHGWSPDFPDMHGVLAGYAPGIRPGSRAGPVPNVDVYPLMAWLLGLKPAADIDGELSRLNGVLEPQPTRLLH